MRKRDRNHKARSNQQKRFHAERRAATAKKEAKQHVDGQGWLRAANAFNKSLWNHEDFDDRELYDLGLLNVPVNKLSMAEAIEDTRRVLARESQVTLDPVNGE